MLGIGCRASRNSFPGEMSSPLSFEDMVPRDMWRDYWDQLGKVMEAMRAAQQKATLVRQHVMEFKQLELERLPSTD